MPTDLVRVRIGRTEYTLSRFWAKRLGGEIVDAPTHRLDGSLRGPSSASSGRKAKPKTTVDEASAVKKAETQSASSESKEND